MVQIKIDPDRNIGTNIKCGLVEEAVALEKMCHWRLALRFQKIKPDLVIHLIFLLPSDPDIDLSATSPSLSA